MLYLTRRIGEKILIGSEMIVTFFSAAGAGVGIEVASSSGAILRKFPMQRGESVTLGDGIELRVTRIKPYSFGIGVDAPKGTEIWRWEVYERVCALRSGRGADT